MIPCLTAQPVKSIAVVCPSWVGDTAMATPVFRALRAHLPAARLAAVLRPGLDEVLAGLPWIDQTIICGMKGWGGVGRLAKAIRSAAPDAVMLLPNSFRSAVAARLSGVPMRIGYDRDHRGWLLTHRLAPPPRWVPIPAVEYYARLAEAALGVDRIDRRIEIRTTPAEQAEAGRLLEGIPLGFVLLNPGANRIDKRWPPERFAAAADALAASTGRSIVVTGSPGERSVLDQVKSAANTPIIDLAERGVRLGSLKAVVERAAVLITNDTGPRHLAAGLGTPVVTLFGPTDHRWTTLDGADERLLLAEPFLPEELLADRHAKACAIDRIPAADVVVAARALLDQPSAGRS